MNATDDPRYYLARGLEPKVWGWPLAAAITIHVLAVLLAIYAPSLFDRRYNMPEVYTVNLFSAGELGSPAASPKTVKETTPKPPEAKPQAVEPPEPPPPKKIEAQTKKVEVTPEPLPVPPPLKAVEKKTPPPEPQAISLKPKPAKPENREQVKVREEKLNRALARVQAQIREKEATVQADQAAKEAVSLLRNSLRKGTTGETQAVGPAGGESALDETLRRYYLAVYARIKEKWVLPNLPDWNPELEAVAVIHINRDGIIEKSSFEKKSDNKQYDQFVLKALSDANPLPPFPEEIQEAAMEIGLRFRPGTVF